MKIFLLGVLFLTTTLTADKAKDANHGDFVKLQGVWKVVQDEIISTPITMTIANDKLTMVCTVVDPEVLAAQPGLVVPEERSTFKLDETQLLRHIDMKVIDEPLGRINKGVYKLDGDTLTMSYGTPGENRPANLKKSWDNPVMVWKRVK